jgi:O-acetyl-ADP-ribose deacetylase (regulator of RNase III)
MIRKVSGNLLDAQAEALVNTVNTVGVMGKGIALQFKRAYPENFKAYQNACKSGEVQPGKMFVFDLGGLQLPRYIVNFPTKRHWKGHSKIHDIDGGLNALVVEIRARGIRSIALPPLGCGNGGLDWAVVYPLIVAKLGGLDGVDIQVYEPDGAPEPKAIIDRTERPDMTLGRAALLGLMARYQVPGYDYLLSLLEVQKLMYLLQEAGEPLKLTYAKEQYGPYADNLRHVLTHIEGHFVVGFGDGRNSPETPIAAKPEAIAEAESFLNQHPLTVSRFERVTRLIEGFETPFGMELLSSVHWCAVKDWNRHGTLEEVIGCVRAWNDRKARLFEPERVRLAWDRLHEEGWL